MSKEFFKLDINSFEAHLRRVTRWIADLEHCGAAKITDVEALFFPSNSQDRLVRFRYTKELLHEYKSTCIVFMSIGTFSKIVSGEPTDLPEKEVPS